MDAFGDNFDQPEKDPAAEFLAREQDALAGLEDDVPPAASVSQTNGWLLTFLVHFDLIVDKSKWA